MKDFWTLFFQMITTLQKSGRKVDVSAPIDKTKVIDVESTVERVEEIPIKLLNPADEKEN